MLSESVFHDNVTSYEGIVVDDGVGEGLRAYRYGEEGDMVAVVYRDSRPLRVSLRCDRSLSKLLRDKYETVLPAEHLNKKYWITIICSGQLPEEEIFDLLRHSYQLTTKKGPLDL